MAEDVRALARSLARDFWEASSSARGNGHPTGEAFRHGLRGAAKGFRKGMHHDWRRWGPPPPRPGYPGARPQAPGHQSPWPQAPGQQPPWPQGRPWPPAGPPWAQFGGRPPAYQYRRPPRPPRRGPLPPVRRKWDASILAAILVVVFGAAWLVGGLGLVHLSTEAVLAAGLMLLGACLIVTARTDWSLSRHAWPVVVGAVLVVGLFATSTSFGVAGALSHVSFGEMPRAPTTPGTVYGGFGQLTVDTSKLPADATLDVESVAGQTTVKLGPDQTATVNAHVLGGQICVDGHASSGIGASSGQATVGQGNEHITIDIHQTAGQVVVGKGCGR